MYNTLLLFIALLALSSCSSTNNISLSNLDGDPLYNSKGDNCHVNVAYAYQIPVLPPNAEIVASIEAKEETNGKYCTENDVHEIFRKEACKKGADLIYIRTFTNQYQQKKMGMRYTGVTVVPMSYTVTNCYTAKADLVKSNLDKE